LIYASDGFALAGWLAARAAGVPYETLARDVVFRPLGMNRSSLKAPRDYGAGLASAYEGDERIPHASVSAGMPSGALITTIEDLARFARMFLSRGTLDGISVLSPQSVDQMMTLGARMHLRVPEGFGLGFGVRELPERRVVWWDGQLPGAASRLLLLPDQNVGVVVLSNRADNAAVARIGNRVLDLIAPRAERMAVTTMDSKSIAGRYRLDRMFAPPRSFIERFANFTITRSAGGGLELTSPMSAGVSHVTPLGGGLLSIRTPGSDEAFGFIDGDRLIFSVVQGRRVSFWNSANAWFVYAGSVVLAALVLLGWSIVRWARGDRHRPSRFTRHPAN
jgi:CubicO group peptidase (beta-lactamase class C family)